jgi:ATP-dependent DNA ligase
MRHRSKPFWRRRPFRAYEEHEVEDIVLKRRNSRYRPGRRSDDWRKIKSALWYERHAQHRRPK